MAQMTYRATVRGGVIELDDEVALADGAEVEVVVKEEPEHGLTPQGCRKGSPQAILAALAVAPRCTPEDVDALMKAIEEGKQPSRFEAIFDHEESVG